MNRPIGVTLLAIGAGLAGLYEIWRALVFMGVVKFTFVGNEVSFPNPQWGQTIWALIIAAIWFWVAVGFWNVRAYAWSFGIFISIFTLIFGFFALLGGGSTMESEFVGWFLALLIFFYLNYPGVREHFVKTELAMLTPEQRAAYDQLQAANMAAAQANAAAAAAPAAAPAPAAPPPPAARPAAPPSDREAPRASTRGRSPTVSRRPAATLGWAGAARRLVTRRTRRNRRPRSPRRRSRHRHCLRHRRRHPRDRRRHHRRRRNLGRPDRRAGSRRNRTGCWRSPCRRTRPPTCSGTCRRSPARRGSRRARQLPVDALHRPWLAQLGPCCHASQAVRIIARRRQLALRSGRRRPSMTFRRCSGVRAANASACARSISSGGAVRRR